MQHEVKRPTLALPAAALLAGVLNGLLGTGGGMVLALALRGAYPDRRREAMAMSTACVLFLSLSSTILYTFQGHMREVSVLPTVLPALLGGGIGALLLGRIRLGALDLIFSLLLLYSGLTLLLG